MMQQIGKGLVILMAVLVAACNGEKAPLPENVQRLTNGSYKDWQLEKATYSIIDVTNQVPECQQDEVYRFYADGRGEVRSGANRCTATEQEVVTTGTWSFEEEGAVLIVNWKNDRWVLDVEELQTDKLKVKGEVIDNYNVTAVFEPK